MSIDELKRLGEYVSLAIKLGKEIAEIMNYEEEPKKNWFIEKMKVAINGRQSGTS